MWPFKKSREKEIDLLRKDIFETTLVNLLTAACGDIISGTEWLSQISPSDKAIFDTILMASVTSETVLQTHDGLPTDAWSKACCFALEEERIIQQFQTEAQNDKLRSLLAYRLSELRSDDGLIGMGQKIILENSAARRKN